MSTLGRDIDRSDGRAKVTGTARYSGDVQLPNLTYAVLITSTIAHGRIESIDTQRAETMPGVLRVISHRNAERLAGADEAKPPGQRKLTVLQDEKIFYNGQPIAVVIALTQEQAQAAAECVTVSYSRDNAKLDFNEQSNTAHKPDNMMGESPDSQRGDPASALNKISDKLDAIFTTPIQHHNPMEPHATVAYWRGDQLTVYDSTQYISGVRNSLAKLFSLDAKNVRVICEYTGGGFGCKGSMWSHVALAAMAAKQVRRPVKLVLQRTQMFGPVGARPCTRQHLVIGSDDKGTLRGLRHDVIAHTSMIEDWTESSALVTRMLYSCSDLATSHRLVPLHVGTPTFMRAPGEATGTFALEVALDELAYKKHIDPIELRLRNYAEIDPEKNIPFSSKSLRECYRRGADALGWKRRVEKPRARRDGDWLIGMGMATATYPTRRSAAKADARLLPNGNILMRAGSQDLGTGTYTIMRQIAADNLQLPLTRIQFQLGDTQFPAAPVSGGSQTAASVGPAVQSAAAALQQKLIDTAIADKASPLFNTPRDRVRYSEGELIGDERRESIIDLAARHASENLIAESSAEPGDEKKHYSMHSFGGVFAEVRVNEALGIVEVSRIVGAYAAGKILNAKTGRSQLLGGIVWGIGTALHEQTLLDTREGRYVNANLADYHVPVNADIHDIEIIFIDEDDKIVNPLGAKGIGEIGITGVAAAIANAVFNATGKRIRELPITPDKFFI